MSTDANALFPHDDTDHPADAIVPELYREMAAPRAIGEPFDEFLARVTALADMTADQHPAPETSPAPAASWRQRAA
ncbi:hypothetical protein [Nocardiopsis suaedae]|uniref:Anti-sigma factor NepR domain-containing protein n=1 Tax=Nocardiopsis suaedae TaxID=3018444 RepID=A0ABT4TID4_9ACTN|nr:hypothetical protein [Nocardiopsis suaedae]MDA2804449.1 hypothetical protein [Nocardiopsis suaedae]